MKNNYLNAVFVAGTALVSIWLLACDSDDVTNGGINPPNPNDPNPIWVYSGGKITKFDQSGNILINTHLGDNTEILGINQENGDVWAKRNNYPYNYSVIVFTKDLAQKKNVITSSYPHCAAFDTKTRRIWVFYDREEGGIVKLMKLNYAGNVLTDRETPYDNLDILDAQVYEQTGEIWAVTEDNYGGDNVLVKFSADGELLFEKHPADLGITETEQPQFRSLAVDQTDGGVWVSFSGEKIFPVIKVNSGGGVIREISGVYDVIDCGRHNGDVLARRSSTWNTPSELRLFTKNGSLIWKLISPDDRYYTGGAGILDYDSSCWCVVKGRHFCELKKANRGGELVVVAPACPEFEMPVMTVVNGPYPYR